MRGAVIVLALVLAAVARADDDDGLLDTPPLGEPIPERLQALEKEWAEDVGTKDPTADPVEDADPFERIPAPEDDSDVEVKAPPAAEPVESPKRPSARADSSATGRAKASDAPSAQATPTERAAEHAAERREGDLKREE